MCEAERRTFLVDRPAAVAVDLDDPAAPTAAATVRAGELGLAGSVQGEVPHRAIARPVVDRADEAIRIPISTCWRSPV